MESKNDAAGCARTFRGEVAAGRLRRRGRLGLRAEDASRCHERKGSTWIDRQVADAPVAAARIRSRAALTGPMPAVTTRGPARAIGGDLGARPSSPAKLRP